MIYIESMLDELVKIGEAQPNHSFRKALSAAVISGAGVGLGTAMAHAVGNQLSKHMVTPQTIQTVKIILPILSGAAVVLGNELRKIRDNK